MEKEEEEFQKFFGEYGWTVIFTNGFAMLFLGAIIWLCIAAGHNLSEVIVNTLVSLTGALVGWALGMFYVPYSKVEAERFAAIGKTVSAFVSGYAISKLDRFLELSMFQKTVRDGQQIEIPVDATWLRFGLLLCSLLLAFLVVFSNRAYFRSEPEQDADVHHEVGGGSKMPDTQAAQGSKG